MSGNWGDREVLGTGHGSGKLESGEVLGTGHGGWGGTRDCPWWVGSGRGGEEL